MGLQFFNTRSRSVQAFKPLDPAGRLVRMYCCGPTVHDYAHIGNFRTFVFADLVRRYLEFKGQEVKQVMNVTDVEDKIINRIQAAGVTLRQFTEQYETAFWEDLRELGCLPPHHTPRATEHIPEIIALIEKLCSREFAYRASDGSVYFNIGKYQAAGFQYGQLLQLNFEAMRSGKRMHTDEYAKESVGDFALWKARTPSDGNVFWPSPWGEGRPGWHIECSAMSMKVLGPSFDLHLGGEDLIFPHHEDELAQSEGTGWQPAGGRFVECWLHAAHLMVDGKKMSKSLGNYFTVRDLLTRGFAGREIRYVLLSAHYREPFNFTLDGLLGARSALNRLDECLGKLKEVAGRADSGPDPGLVERFSQALDDDLNVARGWGLIFEWVREANRLVASHSLNPPQAAAFISAWDHINRVVGVAPLQMPGAGAATNASPPDKIEKLEDLPPEIAALGRHRDEARKAGDFKKADALRHELKERGWTIEDTAKGPRLKRMHKSGIA